MIANFKKKQKRYDNPASFFSSSLVKIFFLMVIVFLIFINIKVSDDRKKFRFQINSLKEKIETIKNKNNTLEQQITRADDKDYIEKIAREELDLQRQNEKVITFIMPETRQGEEINTSNNFLNPKVWLGWFSNGWQWMLNFSK